MRIRFTVTAGLTTRCRVYGYEVRLSELCAVVINGGVCMCTPVIRDERSWPLIDCTYILDQQHEGRQEGQYRRERGMVIVYRAWIVFECDGGCTFAIAT